jgi:hypothetical protein
MAYTGSGLTRSLLEPTKVLQNLKSVYFSESENPEFECFILIYLFKRNYVVEPGNTYIFFTLTTARTEQIHPA